MYVPLYAGPSNFRLVTSSFLPWTCLTEQFNCRTFKRFINAATLQDYALSYKVRFRDTRSKHFLVLAALFSQLWSLLIHPVDKRVADLLH